MIEVKTDNTDIKVEPLNSFRVPEFEAQRIDHQTLRIETKVEHRRYRLLSITAPPSVTSDAEYTISYKELPSS